ncbi:hypothetical protein [Bacillus pinisoli]|uniref:hypothetical protein n=1 Tax=Bacillus pinisoli TaxID=2901866 RepID=UPI001FF34639|nr:hypothetical protein [Bacillus pinisoli]
MKKNSTRIEYISTGPKPKDIEYSIKTNVGGMNGNTSLNSNGSVEIGGHSCTGFALTSKEEKKETTISWNGTTEKFVWIGNSKVR